MKRRSEPGLLRTTGIIGAPERIGPCLSTRSIGNVLLLALVLAAGCATRSKSADPLERRVLVTYYDRNRDGRVDLEKHTYPGFADADWELRDDDYDGKYEKKILYGFAVRETAVDLRVPVKVKISRMP